MNQYILIDLAGLGITILMCLLIGALSIYAGELIFQRIDKRREENGNK